MNSKAFPEGGIYVMRSRRIYLLAVCHPIGVKRHGPHKHNDWLSFVFCLDKLPIFVDPGTFCYTGDIKERCLFRSTSYHNTAVIDGHEQIEIEDAVFGLNKPMGDVRVIGWTTEKDYDVLKAEHDGYGRLPDPVIHRREFYLDKGSHHVRIVDRFVCSGFHTVKWYFHLDNRLGCEKDSESLIILRKRIPVLKMDTEMPGCSIQWELENGWISEEYNKRKKGFIICNTFQGKLNPSLSFGLHLTPLINT